jgi:hypothetical protein
MALALRAAGATYRQIGEQLFFSKTVRSTPFARRWMNWCSIAKS